MKKDNNRIVFTGGHAGTTALSVSQEIRKQKINWEIHWIGSKKAVEGKRILSLELNYFKKYKVIFHSIITGRLQRKFTFWTIPSFLKIPIGFVQALYYLLKIKPFLVLSFGGYASFPVVILSKFFGIPILIHEQTAACGRSNLLSSKFADKVLLARKASAHYFPGKKCQLVGNPILSNYFDVIGKNSPGRKTILIIGGSRGSQKINMMVKESLLKLLKHFKIIHVTGEIDFKALKKAKEAIAKDISNNYEIYPSVDPFKMKNLYTKADYVISRAGANTVSELIAVRKPTIFIPIPFAYLDEQNKNAKFASDYIPTKILNQNKIDSSIFFREIINFTKSKSTLSDKESPDKGASKRIVEVIKKYSK